MTQPTSNAKAMSRSNLLDDDDDDDDFVVEEGMRNTITKRELGSHTSAPPLLQYTISNSLVPVSLWTAREDHGVDQSTLWTAREDHGVDQSINLMDTQAANYSDAANAPSSKKKRTSFLFHKFEDIVLGDQADNKDHPKKSVVNNPPKQDRQPRRWPKAVLVVLLVVAFFVTATLIAVMLSQPKQLKGVLSFGRKHKGESHRPNDHKEVPSAPFKGPADPQDDDDDIVEPESESEGGVDTEDETTKEEERAQDEPEEKEEYVDALFEEEMERLRNERQKAADGEEVIPEEEVQIEARSSRAGKKEQEDGE